MLTYQNKPALTMALDVKAASYVHERRGLYARVSKHEALTPNKELKTSSEQQKRPATNLVDI